jgi:hypothetical protein
MDKLLQSEFSELWQKHFPGEDLPLALFFSETPHAREMPQAPKWECFIDSILAVRAGESRSYSVESLGCEGIKRFAGYAPPHSEALYHFLSCGVPREIEGERVKRTPELVKSAEATAPRIKAQGPYLNCKRWDQLTEEDEPKVITFIVRADAICGLTALANFDRPDNDGVSSPSVGGCLAVFTAAMAENDAEDPRAFIGLFDLFARKYIEKDKMTFSLPFKRFVELVKNMPDSFVVAPVWDALRERMQPEG